MNRYSTTQLTLALLLLINILALSSLLSAQDDTVDVNSSLIVESSSNYGTVRLFPMQDVVRDTNIKLWSDQGYTGNSVRVGVMDPGFGGLLAFESQFGIEVKIDSSALSKEDYDTQVSKHGVQVLEVLHDVAPRSELYACSYQDFDGYKRCIDFMISSGVRIINHSAGVPALPLDGTNIWAREVDRAAERDILWVNAAGNFAQGYIDDFLTDSDFNGYHEFRGGFGVAELLEVPPIGDLRGVVMLSWEGRNDLQPNQIDLDLEVINSAGQVVAKSENPQTGQLGQQAIERVLIDMSQTFYIRVRDVTGSGNRVNFVLFVEFAALPGGTGLQSVIAPADSPNSLTIGALQNGLIAPYSSRGPLVNGVLKPDLVAPGEIRLADGSSFVGTSAASPLVAGVAALIWEANPDFTRDQVYDYLRSKAVLDDSQFTGVDGSYGNGYLYLPVTVPTFIGGGSGTSDDLLGRLPYTVKFDDPGSLDSWKYDPGVWQVVRGALVGQGKIDKPIVILGDATPGWLEFTEDDLIMNFDFNLDDRAGGLRVVFRHTEGVGYEVLELFPGLLNLKRNNLDTIDINNREAEISLKTAQVPINGNAWHNVTLWISGDQIFIYLDRLLVVTAKDQYSPQLVAGEILMQANHPLRPVSVDNFLVQQAERASEHFENAGIPADWTTDNEVRTSTGEEDNNQFLRIQDEVTVTPNTPELQDMSLSCRLWNEEGGYQIRLRDNQDGALLFDFEGGNLTMQLVDDYGDPEWEELIENFYNRGRWDDITINFVGNDLALYKDGRLVYSGSVRSRNVQGPGLVRFITDRRDALRIDDCLITEVLGS